MLILITVLFLYPVPVFSEEWILQRMNPGPYYYNGVNLNGVWGNSASDVFAVGDRGVIIHFDGYTWSPMSSGTTSSLNGVWGSSGVDVFAVGVGNGVYYEGGILHYGTPPTCEECFRECDSSLAHCSLPI